MNNKIRGKTVLAAVGVGVLTVCIFYKSSICAEGIKNGLLLCAGTIIPSLFPFMAVSLFMVNSGVDTAIAKLLSKPCRALLRLPGTSLPAIIMSQIGGYPVGMKTVDTLLLQGKITRVQAQRLCLFCFNSGPAFVIYTVGEMFLNNKKLGVIIYVSTVFSSFVIAILSTFIADKNFNKEDVCLFEPKSIMTSVTASTDEAAKSVFSICAWVVIFSAVVSCVFSVKTDSKLINLCSVLEVTNGVKMLVGKVKIPVLAGLISFGGISVHCQVYRFVESCGLKYRLFFASRVISAAFSMLFCTLILKIFPCEEATFSNYQNIVSMPYSVSIPAAITLTVMCAVLIFEVDTDRKVC